MFRDTVIVAIGTAVSRITGLLRIIVFGVIIGQTALADAFDGANNSPNSIYELLVGGVLAAGLVPLFTQLATQEKDSGDDEGTQSVVTVSLIALVLATIVSIAAAPLIFRMFSLHPSGSVSASQFRHVGTVMTRIFLIQIFFYGLTAIATAILNVHRRFMAAAWAPVLSNLVIISSLLVIPFTRDGTPTLDDVLNDKTFFLLLTLGSTAGIAAMAIVLVPALSAAGFKWRFTPNFKHPAVRSLARLSAWSIGYVVTNQIALIVIKNLARPGSGNQDAYSKAFTFFMLPHGLLAISIATTFVPELARRAHDSDKDGFATWMTSGLRWIALLTLPASVGILILSHPIVSALLEHGHFNSAAATNTARALSGFAVGLVGFSIYIFALRGFYAHHDTRTPFFINICENAVNIILAIFLVDRHGVLGLGLAFGIAYSISAVASLFILHHRYAAIKWPFFRTLTWRAVLATGAMGAVLQLMQVSLESISTLARFGEVFLCITAGLIIYIGGLYALRVSEIRDLHRLFMARLMVTQPPDITNDQNL
ncbi:MAG: murein biosynthesis integral membrane protein MurJ [Ilumatobacteraceae bacterium]|nr:murein biosynthesis integral membrane protein MurJ [Ilumatobacteraceae bacterium]